MKLFSFRHLALLVVVSTTLLSRHDSVVHAQDVVSEFTVWYSSFDPSTEDNTLISQVSTVLEDGQSSWMFTVPADQPPVPTSGMELSVQTTTTSVAIQVTTQPNSNTPFDEFLYVFPTGFPIINAVLTSPTPTPSNIQLDVLPPGTLREFNTVGFPFPLEVELGDGALEIKLPGLQSSTPLPQAIEITIQLTGFPEPVVTPAPVTTTETPTVRPTVQPTASPMTQLPTDNPTAAPTTLRPTPTGSQAPTTMRPTLSPTARPTFRPTPPGTLEPTTLSPTMIPTATPTLTPTEAPNLLPTTSRPTRRPTTRPMSIPSATPTMTPPTPITSTPTATPQITTLAPTKEEPVVVPTQRPTLRPSTNKPSGITTMAPSFGPTESNIDPPSPIRPLHNGFEARMRPRYMHGKHKNYGKG